MIKIKKVILIGPGNTSVKLRQCIFNCLKNGDKLTSPIVVPDKFEHLNMSDDSLLKKEKRP